MLSEELRWPLHLAASSIRRGPVQSGLQKREDWGTRYIRSIFGRIRACGTLEAKALKEFKDRITYKSI